MEYVGRKRRRGIRLRSGRRGLAGQSRQQELTAQMFRVHGVGRIGASGVGLGQRDGSARLRRALRMLVRVLRCSGCCFRLARERRETSRDSIQRHHGEIDRQHEPRKPDRSNVRNHASYAESTAQRMRIEAKHVRRGEAREPIA